ncbi:MAG: glycosyltransferase family 2 protein [Thermoleophilaceae bacterium]
MPSEVAVAVCTNRPPGAVAESLDALRAQVGGGDFALVTSGLGAAQVEAHRAVFDGPLLEEPRPGLSHARNRALAWRPDGVVAFVDDDAVVCEGWYPALRAAWAEAEDGVACIGGPIRPRYETPPPAWLSEPILGALTLLDLGPDARDLDPSVTTVYGANVSFDSAQLRAAGGFDPAFGHSGRRVFFSEEDEAQRALARLGYRVRYVPGAAVLHVIGAERLTRRSFLRRRFAYGAALGLRGARPRALAARQAASSATGALVAGATRRDALAMERAVRAAENLGVLLAPLVARR